MSFLSEYGLVILFYVALVLLIYFNRSKFEFQAKIIALYRTKVGLKLMERIGKRHAKLVKVLAHIGIYVGYLGMILITGIIIWGVYQLFTVPDAPPVVTPVLPGIPIPGSPIFVPFWYGIISLFVVVVIHEFSHGVVAEAYNMKIKSSGFVLFGPLPGAFVEPDEEDVKKRPKKEQLSMIAAGPFSNFLTGVVVFVLLLFVMGPLLSALVDPIGFSFDTITPESPAAVAGLASGMTYSKVNNQTILTSNELLGFMKDMKPGDEVTFSSDQGDVVVTTGAHPDDESKAWLGVTIQNQFANADKWYVLTLIWFTKLLQWIFILSLGLGFGNLLPLGPVDGGRMFLLALMTKFKEKDAQAIWGKTAAILITVLLVLLFVPIIRAVM